MASDKPNPWGGGSVGNWALEAERAEAEEFAAAAGSGPTAQSFPSLKEAAKTRGKKKKGTTFSLSELNVGTHVGPGGGSRRPPESRGLTADELMQLPTGPRERTAEELEQSRLGGGFRGYGSYGGGAASRAPRRNEEDAGSWGGGRRPYGGGFEEDARRAPPSRASESELMPSRADEDDNWAAGKRSLAAPPLGGRDSRDRYQNLGGGGGGGSMRADEAESWSLGKKPVSVRSSSFGSGFRESAAVGAGIDSDRWVRGGGVVNNGEREKPYLALDRPRREIASIAIVEPTKPKSNPFGSARPREEVLAEKGVDWKKADLEIETKRTSRPSSSHSSRPSSAHSGVQAEAMEVEVKPRSKMNPFGDAKPREILLEQKGMDWRKIDLDLEHRAVNRHETEKEKQLKEEINRLKRDLKLNGGGKQSLEPIEHAAEEADILETILLKERELECLIHDLDDKVRFGQRASSERRPGSGGGRSVGGGIGERPSSRSSLSEESKGTDFLDMPRSRGGTGDLWSRPEEERKSHGREGGFFGFRDVDRSRTNRW